MPITRDDVNGIVEAHASVLAALRSHESELAAQITCREIRRIVDQKTIFRICEDLGDNPPTEGLLQEYAGNLRRFITEEQRVFDAQGLFSLRAREMLAAVCSDLEEDFLGRPLTRAYIEETHEKLSIAAQLACEHAPGTIGLMVSWTLSAKGAKALAGIGLAGVNKLALPVDWGIFSHASLTVGMNYCNRQATNIRRFFQG